MKVEGVVGLASLKRVKNKILFPKSSPEEIFKDGSASYLFTLENGQFSIDESPCIYYLEGCSF